MISVTPAIGAADIEAIRALFVEYAESLDFDLCFQGFDEELAALPGCYASPRGCLLLARGPDGGIAGGVGVQPLSDSEAEMKRLYVRPAYRGQSIGRVLAGRAVNFAKTAGCACLRLDTISGRMAAAEAMYRQMGFEETPAYYDNPIREATYYRLRLDR